MRVLSRTGRVHPADVAGVVALVAAAGWAGFRGPAALTDGMLDPQALAVAIAPLAMVLPLLATWTVTRTRIETRALDRDAHRASAMLASVVENADDAMIVLDFEGTITSWNQGAAAMFRVPAETAIGHQLSEFVSTPDAVRVAGVLAAATFAGNTERLVARYNRPDGSTFEGISAIAPVRDTDGTVLAASVIIRDAAEGVHPQRKLAESERRFQMVAESAIDAVVSFDADGTILAWNAAATRIFGWSVEQAIGRPVSLLVAPHLRHHGRSGGLRIRAEHWHRLAGRTMEIGAVRADDQPFPAEVSLAQWYAGADPCYTAFVRDITDRKREEFLIRERGLQHRMLFEHVPAIVFRTEARPLGRTDYISHQLEAILGFKPEAWIADPGLWERQIHPEDLERVTAELEAAMRPEEAGSHIMEYRMLAADGRVVWVRSDAAVVLDGAGNPAFWSGVLTDVTDRKALEEQLLHQAFRDPLTGLANRALFADRVGQAVSRLDRHPGFVGVLMIDLDGFKRVNDSLGHAEGDKLLVAVGKRLQGIVRDGDTVARIGGDEFAVVLEDIADRSVATGMAGRVVAAMRRPIELNRIPTHVSASVGVAVDETRTKGPEWLMRSADVAMYAAKRERKGGWRLYESSMYLAATKQLMLERQLHRAQEKGQLEVVYQPTIDLRTGRVAGVEALLRWRHPKDGLVLPTQFIPMAEETGLIIPIGRWVLVEACRQAREWEKRFGPRTMSVNVSARQLEEDGFAESVARALEVADLAPGRLTLELTESLVMTERSQVADRLTELKRLGIRLAIDDFGTGYSSLSYLRQLPVDILKIDRSFIEGVGRDTEASALTKSIVDLGTLLRLDTIAEGIENRTQAVTLRDYGCQLGQGFYFSRPLPAGELATLLEEMESRRTRAG